MMTSHPKGKTGWEWSMFPGKCKTAGIQERMGGSDRLGLRNRVGFRWGGQAMVHGKNGYGEALGSGRVWKQRFSFSS